MRQPGMNSYYRIAYLEVSKQWTVIARDVYRDNTFDDYIVEFCATEEKALWWAEGLNKRAILCDHYHALKMNENR